MNTRYTLTVYKCLWCSSPIEEVGNRTKPAKKFCRHTNCGKYFSDYEKNIRTAHFIQMNDKQQVKLRQEIWINFVNNNRENELNDEVSKVASLMVDMGKPVEDVMAIIKKAIKRKK
tara:strand:+ start:17828 stop:18175 length:348 start_codon:yes stop_codon:yes gene_type:complete